MTIVRGTFLDTPSSPFSGGALRALEDGALVVQDGAIVQRGSFGQLRAAHPGEEVTDLRDGLVLPGFVDTHVHFPQVRAIGGLGMPLLDWLEQCALPEEKRLAESTYAAGVAQDFVRGMVSAGTTSALVFGAHFASAVDALFTEASAVGLRVASGLVVSDRALDPALLTTPERAHQESVALAARWHGQSRQRYAVTPRFSLSCTEDMLAACAQVLSDVPGAAFTSHVNENPVEIARVVELFGGSLDYSSTYSDQGLIGRHSVLAHNVHPSDRELALLAEADATVSHCPSSNAALGSGLFPMRRHLDHGVRISLGTDVGAGNGFSMFKEGLQAYFVQQLLGEQGASLTPAHLLYLATNAGAEALGLEGQVGDFEVGKSFDAQWLSPPAGSPLQVGIAHAADAGSALAKAFALGHPTDVRGVWVDGERIDQLREADATTSRAG